jgi:L-threonylcarbamoyladenylate synthase
VSGSVGRLDLRIVRPEDADLDPVVRHLAGGGILAYPTETVYGFGGTCRPEAVERVRSLKRRAENRPLLVLVEGPEAASGLVWTDEARELARIFWPGAVTLVLGDPRGIFPPGVRSEEGTVAVRMSPSPWVHALLEAVGEPLTSSSANAPGASPARTGEDALRAGRALGAGRELLVLDAGTLEPSAPSTIVDCTGPRPLVVRAGSVPVHRLRCALPEIGSSD